MKIEFCPINKDVLIHTSKGVYFLRHLLFGWFSMPLQKFLYKRKIYWHDCFAGQCTPMFECCAHKIKTDEEKRLMQTLVRMREEQMPIGYFVKDGE